MQSQYKAVKEEMFIHYEILGTIILEVHDMIEHESYCHLQKIQETDQPNHPTH